MKHLVMQPARSGPFPNAIADEIEGRGDAITEIGSQGTGLPAARLESERGRTNGQLRLFASHIFAGDYLDRLHDEALPTMNGRNAMLPERGGEVATAGIPELVSAQSAHNAPPQKLASQDRRRVRLSRAAVRADLHWPRGDEAAR